LQKTFEGHRTFWNDFSDSTYTVTFLPIKDAPWSDTSRFVSAGGSGLTNSFMSFGTDNPGLTYDLIRYIYVHELMHRWIGIKIENKEEEKQYWFSEGFTDYFTLKNMVRYGLTGIDEWLSAFNEEFIAPHYASPLRAMPNDSLNYERFWSGDKGWEKLPYRRGAIYAFYLNESLLKKSKGRYNLDAFMRELLVLMEQNPGQKLDNTLFKTLLRGKLGKSGVRDFEQFIEKGQPIDLERIPLPPGFGVSVKDRPVRQNFVNQAQKTYPNIPQLYKKSGISEEVLRGGLLR
jgi:predicted metalloprotease with PDZ domain